MSSIWGDFGAKLWIDILGESLAQGEPDLEHVVAL